MKSYIFYYWFFPFNIKLILNIKGKKMKTLLPILLLTLLVGCSQEKSTNQSERIIELNAGVGVVTGAGEFGEIDSKDSKVLTFKINNTGDAPLIGPPAVDNQDFSIIYQQSSCASIAPKQSCLLKVLFDAKTKTQGQSYSANLNLDSAFVTLSGSVKAPIVETPEESISFLSGSSEITEQNFGEILQNKSVIKTITIKNAGSTKTNSTVVITGSSAYVVAYDNCSGKDIKPKYSCQIKVAFNSGLLSGAESGSLSYNGKSISLLGSVLSTIPAGTEGGASEKYYEVVSLFGNLETASVDGGSLFSKESKQLVISFKNKGNSPSPISSASLNNSNMYIGFNQCSNKILAPNSSCQVRLIISAVGKEPNSYSSILSFGDIELPISYLVESNSENPTVACSLLNASGNGVSSLVGVASVSGNLPSCQINSCSLGYVLENNICQQISSFSYRSDESYSAMNDYNFSQIELLSSKLKNANLQYTSYAFQGISRRLEIIVPDPLGLLDAWSGVSESVCVENGGTFAFSEDYWMDVCTLDKVACLNNGFLWETNGETQQGNSRCWRSGYIGNYQNSIILENYNNSFNNLINTCGWNDTLFPFSPENNSIPCFVNNPSGQKNSISFGFGGSNDMRLVIKNDVIQNNLVVNSYYQDGSEIVHLGVTTSMTEVTCLSVSNSTWGDPDFMGDYSCYGAAGDQSFKNTCVDLGYIYFSGNDLNPASCISGGGKADLRNTDLSVFSANCSMPVMTPSAGWTFNSNLPISNCNIEGLKSSNRFIELKY